MVDNECEDSSDCNLNGDCTEGKCECDKVDGVTYLGTHCEIKMTDECQTIHHGKQPECCVLQIYFSFDPRLLLQRSTIQFGPL